MSDIFIRKIGRAGRITLTRPRALNAVTYEMVRAIDRALDDWRIDPDVEVVVIDAAGKKAFSAGGDLAEMYKTGTAGDYDYGRRFWADEYRLNAKIANYPKPYIAFCQGFTMGGGVGVSLHGSHRVVCENSSIAMPECAVGLVPDVGGSYLLGRAPGRVGEYLGVTGFRMNAADAIYAGFADYFVPEEEWLALIADLELTGVPALIERKAAPVPPQIEGKLARAQREIDRIFEAPIAQMWEQAWTASFAAAFAKSTDLASPLSMACAVDLIRRARVSGTVEAALSHEYRFTHRVMEHGDFLEGIRSVIIDKDRSPKWKHGSISQVTEAEVTDMLADLGARSLILS